MDPESLQTWANWAQVISVVLTFLFGVVALVIQIIGWFWPRPRSFVRWIRPGFMRLMGGLAILFLGFSSGFYARSLLSRYSILGDAFFVERDVLISAGILVVALVVCFFVWRRTTAKSANGLGAFDAALPPPAAGVAGAITSVDFVRRREDVRVGRITARQYAKDVCAAIEQGVVKPQMASDLLSEFGFEVYRDNNSFKARPKRRRP